LHDLQRDGSNHGPGGTAEMSEYSQIFSILGKHPRPFARCYEEKGYLPPLEYEQDSPPASDDKQPLPEITLDQYTQLKAHILFLERKLQEHVKKAKQKPKREGVEL